MPTSSIMTNTNGKAIKDAFERIAVMQIPKQRWLGKKNFYKSDTKARVDKETQANVLRRKNKMSEYIAASVILHCSDGWTYLSRAVESLINGDISSAIHFAYYAELRSSMSLLGYCGVGIFNSQHVWFDANRNPTLFKGFTTHSAADNGILELGKLSTKKELIFSLLRVNNRNLTAWIRETGFSASGGYSSAIVSDWLKKWSLDLHLKEDQVLRNEMSYRPHFENSATDIQVVVNKLKDVWNVLEPTDANRFPSLDKYLLRATLEEIYRKVTYKRPSGANFSNFLKNIFNRLGEDPNQVLFKFLTREIEPSDHMIFEEARKDASKIEINRKEPFPIICRAILLLRLATGGAHKLISESSLNPADLRFWWENISLQQGGISVIPSGIETIDLYADIRESIEEINMQPSENMNCIKTAFSNVSGSLFYLKQFQRTAFWGMGL